MTATASPHSADETVHWLGRLTRIGWLSKGFVFVVIGAIAWRIAGHRWEGPHAPANQDGALEVIAAQPLGTALLTAVSVGLLVFMVWNIAQAFVPGSTDLDPLGLAKRIGWFGLGVFYGLVGVAGLRQAWGTSGSDDGSSGATGTDAATLTARVLGAPGGRLLVFAVAIVVAAVGLYHALKGWRRDFLDDVETDDLSADQRRWLGVLGVVGFTARAVVLLVVAGFLIEAAWRYDPDEAVGLDGALRELASVGEGRLLLYATAAGFVMAGLYDMVTFRRQRLE